MSKNIGENVAETISIFNEFLKSGVSGVKNQFPEVCKEKIYLDTVDNIFWVFIDTIFSVTFLWAFSVTWDLSHKIVILTNWQESCQVSVDAIGTNFWWIPLCLILVLFLASLIGMFGKIWNIISIRIAPKIWLLEYLKALTSQKED